MSYVSTRDAYFETRGKVIQQLVLIGVLVADNAPEIGDRVREMLADTLDEINSSCHLANRFASTGGHIDSLGNVN
jgi:hypothetical protein